MGSGFRGSRVSLGNHWSWMVGATAFGVCKKHVGYAGSCRSLTCVYLFKPSRSFLPEFQNNDTTKTELMWWLSEF